MNEITNLERQADRAAAAGDMAAARQSLEAALERGGGSLELWTKLSAIRRALGDVNGSLEAIERALALSPLDFSALLARAMLLERLSDGRAGEAFSRAVAQMPPGGDVPQPMANAIEHAKKRAADHQARVEQRLLGALPSGLDQAQQQRLERFASNTARRTRHFHQEPTSFHFPALPEIEFHDPGQYPGVREIEAATDAIRDEYLSLVKMKTAELVPYTQYPDHVPLAQWRELNNNPDWTAIHLLQNGKAIEANASLCPTTMALLGKPSAARDPRRRAQRDVLASRAANQDSPPHRSRERAPRRAPRADRAAGLRLPGWRDNTRVARGRSVRLR